MSDDKDLQENELDEPEEETEGQEETEGCEPEGCEPDGEASDKKGKKGKDNAKKQAATPATTPAAKPATPTTGAKTFTFPFLVRGAGNMDYYELWQMENGRAYSVQEIRTALIAAGYEEYKETNIDLTATSDGSTLIVHIKGSAKGGRHA